MATPFIIFLYGWYGELEEFDRMRERTKNALIIAAGCWMLGEGSRMICMGIWGEGWVYRPGVFDMFFDWLPLVVLGSVFIGWGFWEFYELMVAREKKAVASRNATPKAEHRFRAFGRH